jgi:ABC-type phosphate transport system substrate-binding protein
MIRRIAIIGAALVALVAFGGLGASSASAVSCGSIFGAGSSLQKNAQLAWKESFISPGKSWLTSNCGEEPAAIEYNSTSSGKGKTQWGKGSKTLKEEEANGKFPAFVGSDTAAGAVELTEMKEAGNTEVMAVPVAQSAIAVLVTLPMGCFDTPSSTALPQPRVSNQRLEEEWASDSVSGENLLTNASVLPGNCTMLPALYARASSSGTSAGFKRYLGHLKSGTALQKEWESVISSVANAESPTQWVTTVLESATDGTKELKFEKGSQEVEGVYSQPTANGAIGYADLADAVAKFGPTVLDHVDTVLIGTVLTTRLFSSFYVSVANSTYLTSTSHVASPAEELAANCGEAKYGKAPKTVLQGIDWSEAYQTNIEEPKAQAYPICTITYDLVWHNYEAAAKREETLGVAPVYKESLRNSVLAYLKYIVSSAGQSVLKTHNFGELETAIRKSAETGVSAANIEF